MGGAFSLIISVLATLLFFRLGTTVLTLLSAIVAMGCFWSWGIMHNYAFGAAKRREGFTGGFFDITSEEAQSVSDWVTWVNLLFTLSGILFLLAAILASFSKPNTPNNVKRFFSVLIILGVICAAIAIIYAIRSLVKISKTLNIASRISRELAKNYLKQKKGFPSDDEKTILLKLWTSWLTYREEAIRSSGNADQILRLDLMKDEIVPPEQSGLSNLFADQRLESLTGIFDAVLYIEADVSSNDRRIFLDCMKVFVMESKKLGLDYTQELESWVRTMSIMGTN